MNLRATIEAFAAVLPAELPDKTMIAVVVLVTRYMRPLPVWLGAGVAFTFHVVVAVTAGRLLTLLSDTVVGLATTVMFAVGAAVLWREAGGHDEDDDQALANGVNGPAPSPWSAFAGSAAMIGLAEWGDLTQFATAGVAARTGAPVAAGVGALAALLTVAGMAVVLGQTLVARLPIHALQRIAAAVFALLAVVSLVTLVS